MGHLFLLLRQRAPSESWTDELTIRQVFDHVLKQAFDPLQCPISLARPRSLQRVACGSGILTIRYRQMPASCRMLMVAMQIKRQV
jgi:hypothetical protein